MSEIKGYIYLGNALCLLWWMVTRDAGVVQLLNLWGTLALGAWLVRPRL